MLISQIILWKNQHISRTLSWGVSYKPHSRGFSARFYGILNVQGAGGTIPGTLVFCPHRDRWKCVCENTRVCIRNTILVVLSRDGLSFQREPWTFFHLEMDYGLVALQAAVAKQLFFLLAEFSVPCVIHGLQEIKFAII